jgi:hypothetical protein
MKLCLGLSITQLLSFVGYSTSTAALIFDNNNNNNNKNNKNSHRSLSSSQTSLKKVLAKARRLEDAGGGDDDNAAAANDEAAEENMEAFLMDYSLKFMKCIPDQVLTDADYIDHFGVVIFRLCPSNKCSNTNGCTSGYADFAVDVGTYVDAFLTDQQDNMNWDDENFDGDNMGQCTQYEGGDDDGGDAAYYIGPGCTSDGTGVKMGVYEDQYCYEESETTFETTSNGWSLPYSDGGLVSTQCTDCIDDDGEIREMCLDLYDYSPYRCEADLEYTHYYYDANFEIYRYGKDTTGCNSIHVMQNPKGGFSSEAVWTDAILVVILIAATGVGLYYYSEWWTKRMYIKIKLLYCFDCLNVCVCCVRAIRFRIRYFQFKLILKTFFSFSIILSFQLLYIIEKGNLEKIEDDDDDDYRLDDDNSAANSGYGDDFSGSGHDQPSGLDESGFSNYKNDAGTSPNAASGTMT